MVEVKNPYAGWRRGLWITAAVAVLLILPIVEAKLTGRELIDDDIAIPLAAACGTLLALALLMLPFMAHSGRKALREIQDLLAGNHWAHSRYAEDEWRRFADAERARTQRKARKLTRQLFVILFLFIFLLALSQGAPLAAAFLGAALAGLGIGLLVGFLVHRFGRSTYNRRLTALGEVYIGPHSLYQEGRYHTWRGLGTSLEKVEVQPGDPAVLHFEVLVSSGRSSRAHEIASLCRTAAKKRPRSWSSTSTSSPPRLDSGREAGVVSAQLSGEP